MAIEKYYSEVYSDKQFEADLARKDRLKFLFPVIPKGKRILSIGSGPCVDINFLITGNEVHAVDISDKALNVCQKQGVIPHKLDLFMIEKLPFEDESFDILIATDILEHLFDPKKLLQEMYRILKPDGFAIISVPNHFYWSMRLRILMGKGIILPFHDSNEWDYFHIRFFTLPSFKKLLNEVGFIIIEEFYDKFINVPKGLPRFIDRYLARKFPTLFSMHFMVKVTKR